jgi:hypothetical protein
VPSARQDEVGRVVLEAVELVDELPAVVSGVDVEREVCAGGDEDGKAEEEEGGDETGAPRAMPLISLGSMST